MIRRLAFAALAATLALASGAPTAQAQKALVYCPVGVDAAGCDRVVAALQSQFPGGVDRGYDGSGGTIDIRKVDLQHYGVFVVPSLADAAGRTPYGLLRAAAPQLRMALTGRVAVYSGAPDQGIGNRPDKETLIQSLAGWAADGHTRKTGLVGLVALLDLSDNVADRYSWIRAISAADVSADAELNSFGAVHAETEHGRKVVEPKGKPIIFPNMASYGLHIGARAAARTLVGATAGAGPNKQSILVQFTTAENPPESSSSLSSSSESTVTSSGGSRSLSPNAPSFSLASTSEAPTLTTDKSDYFPGDTVTFTGTGWAAGDTVVITVHEDPTWSYPDRQYTAIADASGAFSSREMVVDTLDFGAIFTATAVANPSGLVAQTTFTDARTITNVTLNGGTSVTVTPTTSISVVVSATTDGTGANARWRSTGYRISTTPPGALTCVDHPNHDAAGSFTETFSIAAPSVVGTYNAYLIAYNDDNCGGGASVTFTRTNGVTVNPGPLVSFEVTNTGGAPIPNQIAGTPFDIKVRAIDASGNTVTSFSGGPDKVNITSTGTLSAGSGATAAFTNGVLASHSVTISNGGTFTITATRNQGGSENGTSNSFTVTQTNQTLTVSGTGAGVGTITSTPPGINCTSTGGTTSGTCSFGFTAGSTVTLAAIQSSTLPTAAGSTFDAWSGDGTGTTTRSVTMDAARSVTASFKANQTITFGALGNKTYGDAPFNVSATASSNLSVSFATQTATTCSVAGSTVTILAQGTCTIRATQAGDASYNAAPNVDQSFTIDKKNLTATITASDKFYDGTTTATITNCTPNGVVGSDVVTCAASNAVFASADASASPQTVTADITLGGAGAGNYTVTSPATTTAKINPKGVVITPNSGQTKVFGAADPTLTFTNDGGLADGAFTGALARAAGENVGSYAINLGTLSAGTNYALSLSATTVNFTITAKPVVITPNAGQTKVFGASDPTLTFTNDGGLGPAAFSGALARAPGENVGAYPINIGTLTAGTNYSLSLSATPVNFTITPKPIVITPNSGQTKIFGAADPTLTFTNDGGLAGGAFTGFLGRAAGENVGSYAINIGNLSAGPNYTLSLAAGTVNFTITPKPIVITPNSGQTKVFGQSDPALTYTPSPALLGTDAFTGALSRDPGENVGSYAITLGTLTAGSNYSLSLSTPTVYFTITPKPVTITPTAGQFKIFGDADPAAFAFTNNGGLVAADFGATKLGRVAGENAGTYAFTLGTLSAGPNYILSLSSPSGTFEIKPKPITVTPASGQSKVYGNADPTLTYSPSPALLNGDAFTGVLGRASGETVGNYPINLGTLSAGPNYILSLSATPVNFAINPRPATWTTDPNSKVYGYPDPTPLTTGSGSNFLAGDGVSATYSRAAGESVADGPYHITATLSSTSGALGNYYITNNGANFTITQRPATWTTNPSSKIYGASDPSPLTTGSGNFLVADNVTASYTRAPGETVAGSPYLITANLNAAAGVLANYIITNNGASFTINPRPLTVTADNKQRVYGEANPTFTATITGFANSETLVSAGVTGAPTFSGTGPSSTATSPPADYVITPAAGNLAAPNYTFDVAKGAVFNNGTLKIEKANTTTTVATSVSPSVFGQQVTFTATVLPVAPGAGTRTGSVQFSIDGSPVGSAVTVNASTGQATYTTNSLSVGNHSVSAAFGNDPYFNGSNGSLASPQSVGPASTTTTVTSSVNPSTFGNQVTFTATVAVVAPGSGTPNGNVQFEIDGANVGGPVALDSYGKATYQTSTLTVPGSPHTVKAYYAGVTSYTASNGTLSGGQGVQKASTTTTVTVTPNSAQYSDAVTFEATISPAAINGLNPATTATFKVGTQTMGTETFALVGGVWKATLSNKKLLETVAGQMAPGSRTVTAEIGGIDPNFNVSNGTANLTINQENAGVTYSGLLFISTPSATQTTAAVTLRATIQDITALNGDAQYDANAGDIRNARVTFVNRDNSNSPFTGCTNLVPVLVDPSDSKTATVSCTVTLSAVSGSEPSATYNVGTVVSNYYQDDEAEDMLVTVTVGGTGFITGGGYLVSSASSGQYSATAPSKLNFGYSVKFNKQGTNLQGHLNIIIRKQVGGVWKVYQIKSNSITSLIPNVNQSGTGGTAVFASKANLTDITNPLNPVSLGGNLTFEMQLSDNGEPGSTDTIGFTLWNSSNALLFSSKWDGSKTIEQLLGGGNLQVR